ncbi:unnamed protein product [Dracunculus medinensis]|uniref:Uncharacterized protein n=1 Tax=Dracunculus medinensis TaxID=318479 RepID=A0A0N4URR0_DRAME|nr:unnamed protein product [Dracunculus medinensis]
MYFIYLPILFFISIVTAANNPINVCNKAVQVPAQAPPPQMQTIQRPTVDPNLCLDLDPQACSEIFKLDMPEQAIPEQLNP